MKAKFRYALVLLALAICGSGIWLAVHHAGGAAEPAAADEPQGVAAVTTTAITSGQVSQTVTCYGNVTAQPGAIAVLSASVECRVSHLHVAGGQSVDTGSAVIEIEPSPDARLALIDARNALEGAKKESASAHQRLDLKLATNSDAQTADQVMQAAQAKFDDLDKRGAGEQRKLITAATAAVVAKVDVQEGQLVPAGAALVELVPRGQIEVRLGVEPGDAPLLRANQPVQLFPSTADEDESLDGSIRLVTQRVNPESRLVDVLVKPGETDALLLDGFIHAELTLKTVSGLIVPHEALLPDDDGFSVFTVVDGHAIRHAVKVAVQNDKQAVITGDGLHQGDAVVIAGNLELDDKAAVTATQATSVPTAAEAEK